MVCRVCINSVVLVAFIAIVAACSSPPRVDYVADTTLDVPVESLVLLDSGGRHTAQIRGSLRDAGFGIKAFAATRRRTQPLQEGETIQTGSDTAAIPEARYGITLIPGGVVDGCVYNDAVNYGVYTMELIDIPSNETIAVVSSGGWSRDCGLHKGDLFSKLAKLLREAVDGLPVAE